MKPTSEAPRIKYKTLSKNAENDTQQITPTNEAAQLIHSSHLPLSADNSPARRPLPAVPHLSLKSFRLALNGARSLYRREFLWFLHVVFGN